MKASMTLFIALYIFTTHTFSQNYQTVQSNEIHYYATQEYNYVLASKFNDAQLVGSDSVFTGFETVRENPTLSLEDPCKFYLGDSWLGSQVIIEPNGRNVFYNEQGESIIIETQAALADTFMIYTYQNGDYILGVVTNIIELSVLDEMDTVKMIKMISNVPLPLSNDRIMLSKNHGAIEFFVPYSFPYPYSGAATVEGDNDYPVGYDGSYLLVGIDTSGFHKPTVADVHDYEIGDFYQLYEKEIQSDGSIVEKVTERSIVNEFIWPQQDSLVYFVQESVQKNFLPPSGPSETSIWTGELEAIWYTNLSSWNTPYLPEEFNGTGGWTSLLINACNDVEEIVRKQPLLYDGVDPCLQYDPYGSNLKFKTISGVGWIETNGFSSNQEQQYEGSLVYYKKANGNECGSKEMLDDDERPETVISVFPNPARDIVNFEWPKSSTDGIITIVDKNGKVIRVWKGTEIVGPMSLEDIEPGAYHLIFQDEEVLERVQLIRI